MAENDSRHTEVWTTVPYEVVLHARSRIIVPCIQSLHIPPLPLPSLPPIILGEMCSQFGGLDSDHAECSIKVMSSVPSLFQLLLGI